MDVEEEIAGGSISKLGGLLETGELRVQELLDIYLRRIGDLDRSGPALNAVIELNPQAENLALRLQAELDAGRSRGPLHGVPVLLKDNIDTADAMSTTAGSLALEGHRAALDAGLVLRLREAGALILGKTNLSEWANFRGSRSTSGWSSRGGQTKNPHALDRTPCGSSSGSAAAVAASLCAAAVGTETDGSIVCPAQTNGIVGLKPTLGLVSRSGVIPIAASQDTAGPMTRSVADAALLLGALAGPDPRDPSTAGVLAPGGAKGLPDYRPHLRAEALRGARIGVARDLFGNDARVLGLVERSLAALRDEGALLFDVEVGRSEVFAAEELEVLLHEFKAGLEAYLRGCGDAPVRSLAELRRYNEEHRESILPFFGQERIEEALARGGLDSRVYRRARARSLRGARRGLDAALGHRRLDCLVFPTGGPAWLVDTVNGDGGRSWDMDSSSHAAVAGYPHLTVPMGFIRGLPLGLSFVGRPWDEGRLLGLGYAYERATGYARPPRFLPRAELGD